MEIAKPPEISTTALERKWAEEAANTPPTLEELNVFLAERLPKWWLPDALECVDALPIGPTGKILKTKLREKFKAIRLR